MQPRPHSRSTALIGNMYGAALNALTEEPQGQMRKRALLQAMAAALDLDEWAQGKLCIPLAKSRCEPNRPSREARAAGRSRRYGAKAPRRIWSRSSDSKSALKLPSPKP